MKYFLFFTAVLYLSILPDVSAQLPNGSIAPNWTLTDINGNTHTLYDYLDQGKMVVLDFGETRCTPCWEYMNSGELENFWEEHGPGGLDDAMVFFVEAFWESGMDDLLGLTPFSNGNWIEACPFPILDLFPGDSTAYDYLVTYFPTIFAVCHDRTLYELGMVPTEDWIDFLESCQMEVEADEIETAICAGEGAVTVTATGGFTPYSYEWESGETTQTLSGLVSGTYNVSVTEGKGKITTLEVFVPGAEEPLALNNEIEPALCFNSSDGNILIEMHGGQPAYAYTWNTGANTNNLLNVHSGTYTVTVTDALGCTMHQSFYVPQPDILAATFTTTPVSCDHDDGTITLSIAGGVGNYTVTASEGMISGNQILGLSLGNILVEVEDENGCVWSEEILTTPIDYPLVTVTENAEINCIQLNAALTGFASGGYNEYDFQWTTTDGLILSNPPFSEIMVGAPGSYQLHVTDLISGCETFATSMVQNGVIIPDLDAGAGTAITCENLQVVLDGTGDSLNIIDWTTPDGSIVSGSYTYHPVIDAPGTYYINATHSVTHCTNQDSVVITDESNPVQSAFTFVTSSLTIAATDLSTGSNPGNWSWNFGDGHTSNEQHPVHVYETSGTYDVCLNVENGCGASQSCQLVQVAFEPSALEVEVTITHISCFGDATGTMNATVTNGTGEYEYQWTGADTVFTTPYIQALPAGSYQLIVTDSLGNTFIGSYEVTQPPPLVLEPQLVHPLCHGDANGSIIVTVSGGAFTSPYTWTVEPANSLPAGNYTVTATDPNGCTVTEEIDLTEPAALVVDSISVTDATSVNANDGSITLAISGGTSPYAVEWSNGMNGTSINSLLPGEYSYTITDAQGCQHFPGLPITVLFSTAIEETEVKSKISIFPNPSDGNTIIKWNDIQSTNTNLTLMNLEGKVISSKWIDSPIGSWDLSATDLSPGVYLIFITFNEKLIPMKLVVL